MFQAFILSSFDRSSFLFYLATARRANHQPTTSAASSKNYHQKTLFSHASPSVLTLSHILRHTRSTTSTASLSRQLLHLSISCHWQPQLPVHSLSPIPFHFEINTWTDIKIKPPPPTTHDTPSALFFTVSFDPKIAADTPQTCLPPCHS